MADRIWNALTNMMKCGMIVAPKFPDALVHRVFFVMQVYLTNGWRLSFTHAAAIMNLWEGMSLILPPFLQFLADTLVGNFAVALISTLFSTVGIGMVALSVPEILDHYGGRCRTPGAETCLNGTQEALFYTAVADPGFKNWGRVTSVPPCTHLRPAAIRDSDHFSSLVLAALGRAGISFSLDALCDEQGLPEAMLKYLKFCVWVDKIVMYLIGSLLIFVWTRKWKLLFGIPAIYSAFMGIWFLCGSRWYNRPKGKGSPLTSVCRVIYSAATSNNKSQPLNPTHDDQKPFFDRFPRCLDRALPFFDEQSVETAKFVVRMAPISITFLVCGMVSSVGNTYFVEQANHMNRRVGKWNVPLLALQLPVIVFKLFHDMWLYIFFKIGRKKLRIDLPIGGIGAAMVYSVLCCVAAAAMEMKRLRVIRSHGLIDKPDDEVIPMHAAWLLFQFFLLAGLDSFLRKSIVEFYKDRAPQWLRKKLDDDKAAARAAQRYFDVAVNFVCGLGFLSSVLSVYVVRRLSDWFQYTLNKSHLDRYYWVLAGLSGVNLVVFNVVGLGYMRTHS
ncbi:protein NRT1/ PTR FAMILY 5.5-like [Salvia miltiorrhiza]|uniref:protein NRT1/ PTR FAMILY 5.5-like n=1 Tax=Salvia miltiorrhiza TaxID=226208 RepID=UPI0025AC5D54|nr:protein NRT1/ PTR FAMILY 5.5-like [Salvia miltiorrhiza]